MTVQRWELDEIVRRVHMRVMNSVTFATLTLGDDTNPTQTHQTEGYKDELRPAVRRISTVGLSDMPLPGAKAVVVYPGGQRSLGVIIATEDPRYRPKGQKPGEAWLTMIDGASGDGTGGTLRTVLRATLGWLVTLAGKTLNLGNADTTTIVLGGNGVTSLTIRVAGGTKVRVTAGGTTHPVQTTAGPSTVLEADA